MTIDLFSSVAALATALVFALALCRAAAAGDRSLVDAGRTTGPRAKPERSAPFASSEWARARRERDGTGAAPRGATHFASISPQPAGTGSVGSRNRLVLALAAALFAVIASPCEAAAHRLSARNRAAASSSCPDAELRPNGKDLGRIRAATLCLVNRERAVQGERPLAPNERLEHAAQAHTESMAFGNYFEHVGPRGETVLSRVRAAGYIDGPRISFEVGENIGWGTLWEATPHAIVAAWMASPGHRANILDSRFRDTAIGVCAHPPSSLARGQAGAVYTQDFGGQ